MGVLCQILIKKSKDGIHRPGSTVRGVIKYAIDEPTEYKAVILSFVGNGKCSWEESSGTGSDRKTTTYYGTEDYFSYEMDILNNKGQTVLIKPGTYEHHFEFLLPEDIPASFKDETCIIKYELELKFKKPKCFSVTKKFNTEITVFNAYVKPSTIEGITIAGIQKKLLSILSAKERIINVKAEVSNTIFKPGDKVDLNFVVTNDTNITIPTIRTEIIETTTYTADCGNKKRSFKSEVNKETPSVPKNAVANMSTVIPILPHFNTFQNSKIMLREYVVKVTLRLPMPHINSSVNIPICIGNKYEDAMISNEEVEEEETEDGPPSYWEVMNEDNKQDKDDGDEKFEYEDKTEKYEYEDNGTEEHRIKFGGKS